MGLSVHQVVIVALTVISIVGGDARKFGPRVPNTMDSTAAQFTEKQLETQAESHKIYLEQLHKELMGGSSPTPVVSTVSSVKRIGRYPEKVSGKENELLQQLIKKNNIFSSRGVLV